MENLLKELRRLEDQIQEELEEIDDRLKILPKGRLTAFQTGNVFQYRWRREAEGGRRMYLSKKRDMSLIRQLGERRYLEELKRIDEFNLGLVRQAIQILEKWIPKAEAYTGLPKGIQVTTQPKDLTDEKYAAVWLSHQNHANYHDEACIYQTTGGEWVRSKSEVIIANTLHDMGLPYKYEEEIYLNGHRLLPDFTILDRRTRTEVYYEHFGLMSEADYADTTCRKVNTYSAAGYQVGTGLLLSMETSNVPLQPNQVRDLLESRFLPDPNEVK